MSPCRPLDSFMGVALEHWVVPSWHRECSERVYLYNGCTNVADGGQSCLHSRAEHGQKQCEEIVGSNIYHTAHVHKQAPCDNQIVLPPDRILPQLIPDEALGYLAPEVVRVCYRFTVHFVILLSRGHKGALCSWPRWELVVLVLISMSIVLCRSRSIGSHPIRGLPFPVLLGIAFTSCCYLQCQHWMRFISTC